MRVLHTTLVPVGVFSVDARTPNTSQSTLSMFDNFSDDSGAITGETSTSGQTWASMGGVTDAGDFQAGTGDTITRADVSDTNTDFRYGRGIILGTATPTNVQVSVSASASSYSSGAYMGVIARFTDNDNFLGLALRSIGYSQNLRCFVVVAGTPYDISNTTVALPFAINTFVRIQLTVDSSGSWAVMSDGTPVASGIDSRLSSTGVLASGKSGLYDWQANATACTRPFINWS
jgi:hypothetical protein